jgi:hypothetical protein
MPFSYLTVDVRPNLNPFRDCRPSIGNLNAESPPRPAAEKLSAWVLAVLAGNDVRGILYGYRDGTGCCRTDVSYGMPRRRVRIVETHVVFHPKGRTAVFLWPRIPANSPSNRQAT